LTILKPHKSQYRRGKLDNPVDVSRPQTFQPDARDPKIVTTEPLNADRPTNASIVNEARKILCSALLRLSEVTWTWRTRARSRDELAQLNDQDLKDIGLSRADAYRESSKPFWQE
jgi:uncharacterized protein YjiS (DUF1127 family)